MEKCKYKYKFSIIIAVYNVEDYLENTIKSVIDQTIGFEDNVQLILINDGSKDESGKICMEYASKYPNNIIYKYKKNGGVSSARNLGLKYAKGEYIHFMDSNDTLSNSSLHEVYEFFRRNGLCVDLVAIPVFLFGEKRGLFEKYKLMGKNNRIIDLLKEPYNFILNQEGVFYKSSEIKNLEYIDNQFPFIMYDKNSRIGYVCEKKVKYNHRKFAKNNELEDCNQNDKNYYLEFLNYINSVIDKNNIKDYHKELILFKLTEQLKNIGEEIFDNKTEYKKIISEYKKLISLVDVPFILKYSKFCDLNNYKMLLLKLSDREKLNDDDIISVFIENMTVRIQKVSFEKNNMNIDLTFNNYDFEDYDLLSFNDENEINKAKVSKNLNSSYDAKVGNFNVGNTKFRRFSFDLNKTKSIKFIIYNKYTQKYYPVYQYILNDKSQFSSELKYVNYKKYNISFNGRKFKIKNRSKINNKYNAFKRTVSDFLKIAKTTDIIPWLRLFTKRNKKYILINDRPGQGGDNGEALFKYINKYDKKLAKITYFVINKDSKDYKRLKKIGKIVSLGSTKHKFLFLNSKYIYSSHTLPAYFNAFSNKDARYYRDLFKYEFIWLQHGITQNDISSLANSYIRRIDYVITATEKETIEFKKDKYFYEEDHVLLTGFSRYDLLEDNSKNIISIAPTWRRELSNSKSNVEFFESSEYYRQYISLITNRKLLNLLEQNNYILKFVLHPEMTNYVESFKKYQNKCVKIIEPQNVSYSKMFEESKLFITDFSSTFFDFAYLKKPEIFFQFDKDKFYSKHYKRGYFTIEKDGFGDVLINVNEVVDKIEYYFNNNFQMENKYIKKVESTFKYTDKNNSKRILDATYYKKMF